MNIFSSKRRIIRITIGVVLVILFFIVFAGINQKPIYNLYALRYLSFSFISSQKGYLKYYFKYPEYPTFTVDYPYSWKADMSELKCMGCNQSLTIRFGPVIDGEIDNTIVVNFQKNIGTVESYKDCDTADICFTPVISDAIVSGISSKKFSYEMIKHGEYEFQPLDYVFIKNGDRVSIRGILAEKNNDSGLSTEERKRILDHFVATFKLK